MSDRRPKFADLLVAEWVDDPLTKESGAGQYVHRYATADEKVDAVRRGVESGEIEEGRMRAWCKTHEAEGIGYCWRGAFLESADKRFCEMIQAVVIPVSQEDR